MNNFLNNKEVYLALSELFTDSKVNYKYIASITKNHSEAYIEYILFDFVAPVCHFNTVGPTPTVIYFFDEKYLIDEILKIKKIRKTIFGKIYYKFFSCYLKIRFKKEWETLKTYQQKTQ